MSGFDRNCAQSGFTLVELLAVLILLGVLAVVAIPRYANLQTQASQQAAYNLLASAQSQLSIDFSKRVLSGQTLSVDAQSLCNQISISNNGPSVGLVCTGNITDNFVNITATGDAETVVGTWVSPLSGGS